MIALSLMAFIYLLLISFSTLVMLEVRLSATQKDLTVARENAKTGMLVALGRLQSMAGPDQRVTGTASILDNEMTLLTGQTSWSGVWDANPASQDYGSLLGWLVSGVDPGPGKEIVDAIRIYRGFDMTDDVWVGKVSMDPAGRNSFAYWVSDEGVKAKLNPVADEPGGSVSSVTGNPLSLGVRPGWQFVDDGVSAAVNKIQPDDLRRLLSRQQIHLTEPALDIREGFHDYTMASYRLLTDTMRGGWKRDLSTAFENDAVFAAEFNTVEGTYHFVDIAGEALPAGFLNWGILRSYYQQKNIVGADGLVDIQPTLPAGTYISEGKPYFPANFSGADFDHFYQENSPMHAVISRLQLGVKIEYRPYVHPGTGELEYWYPRILLKPVVGLYNPYNVRLRGFGSSQRIAWSLDVKANIRLNGSSPATISINDLLRGVSAAPPSPSGNVYLRWLFATASLDFQPGETRYYTMSKQQEITTHNYILIESQWSEDGALYFDLQDRTDLHLQEPENTLIAIDVEFGETGGIWFDRPSTQPPRHIQYMTNITGNKPVVSDPVVYDGAAQDAFGNPLFDQDGLPVLEVNTQPVDAFYGFWLRHTKIDSNPMRNLLDSNVRWISGRMVFDGFDPTDATSPFYMISPFSGYAAEEGEDRRGLRSEYDVQIDFSDGRLSGFWGSGNTALDGVSRVLLFDVPRAPLVSLGSFQHANLSRYNHDPTYAFGNSYANPRIRRDRIREDNFGPDSIRVYDLSYISNHEVWDSAYFSTLPPALSESARSDLLAGKLGLPNPRIRINRHWLDEKGLAALDTTKATDATSVTPALVIDGGFNINSTSQKAWKALLSSLNDLRIPAVRLTDGRVISGSKTPEDKVVFSRFLHPADEGFDNSSALTNRAYWLGYRLLSGQQIEDLADAIVAEVKKRGPFLSLADFVNRRLEDGDLGLMGTLQAALDSTLHGVNSLDPTLTGVSPGDYGSVFYNDSIVGEQASAYPGSLLQSDVLQALGPVLTARSDTFIIHSYGEVRDPLSGATLAEAWLEATVQRIPETVTGSNHDFERRFIIKSFRWINSDEN